MTFLAIINKIATIKIADTKGMISKTQIYKDSSSSIPTLSS